MRSAPVGALTAADVGFPDDLDPTVRVLDPQIGVQPDHTAFGEQFQGDRRVVGVSVGGVEDRPAPPGDGSAGWSAVSSTSMTSGSASRVGPAADLGGLAEEPLQQVQGVDGLVDQHPAAGFGPATAPGPAPVVRLVAMPGDAGPTAEHGAHRARSPAARECAGRCVVAVLEAHARPWRRSSAPRRSAAASATVVATGFSSSTCTPRARQSIAIGGVQVVRRADVHHVRPFPVEQSWPGRGGRRRRSGAAVAAAAAGSMSATATSDGVRSWPRSHPGAAARCRRSRPRPTRSGAAPPPRRTDRVADPGQRQVARAPSRRRSGGICRVGIDGTSTSIMKSPVKPSGKLATHAARSAWPVPGSAQIRPGRVASR